jgi:hypothetical protein
MRCISEGYTISVSEDGNQITVVPSDIVQNLDFSDAVALCGGGLGSFPAPCPSGARNTLLNDDARLGDRICNKDGAFILGKVYSVESPSSISSYGPQDHAFASNFCGSINLLVDRYNQVNPAHPIPHCNDRHCIGDYNSGLSEEGYNIDDIDWKVIVEMSGGVMITGGKACSMNWPPGPVADGYSEPRPPATWVCPVGTSCSTTSIGGCNGSNVLGSGEVRKMLDRAQNVLASKRAQSCLTSGRFIARDADKKLRCYGTGRKGTPSARIDTVSVRTAADCWNIGGALSGQGGKMLCLPNIAGLKGRKTAQEGGRKN